jgi:membrane protease YdiL (CAAX protease family)
MINTPYKELEKSNNQMHPGQQFLIFCAIFIGILIVGNIIGVGIITALYGLKTVTALGSINTTVPHFATALWILQITGTTFPIFAAPVFFALVIVRDPQDYIKPSFSFPWGLILLILAIMFISNPIIEFLSNINQKMVLPHWLKWMRESEDTNQKLMDAMLQMKTIWNVIADVLVVGLLTAIVEEFMFRGVIQTIFVRWTKNIHVAIWVTAILFSAFHMEFFGFLPRLLLGVLFGYFVAWSGSIWTSVWAHFLNNGAAVVVTYLFQQKLIKMNPDDQHVFNYTAYLVSTVILLSLMFIYRKIATENQQIVED